MNYRLAPEHPFPTPFNDSYDALKWAISSASSFGGDAGRILLAGSSAGGNLAAAVCQQASRDGLKGVIGQVLIIPATCHYKHHRHASSSSNELKSFHAFSGAPLLSTEMMMGMWGGFDLPPKRSCCLHYTTLTPWTTQISTPPRHQIQTLVSPPSYPKTFADSQQRVSTAPRLRLRQKKKKKKKLNKRQLSTDIQVAGSDPLCDEGIAYAQSLTRAGVETKMDTFPGLPHGFHTPMLSMPSREKHLTDLVAGVEWLLRTQRQGL